MNNKVIFSMYKVGKIYQNKKHVLKDISLSFFYGAKIGVLGLNGSGKSTLLKIIAGIEKDYLGEISVSKGYNIGYLEQVPTLDPNKTVKEVVSEGVQEVVDLLKSFDDISNALGNPDLDPDEMNRLIDQQGELQTQLEAKNAWDLDARLELAMDSLRCPPEDMKISLLSGGEKRRVALCRLLLQEPEILLLDEPTNHLDAETVYWLERHLQNYQGTVIAVTHDRYFLDNVAGWILELDRGEGIPWEGNYSSWLEQKTRRLSIEEKHESKRQRSLARELEWIRSNPRARHAKSKARINNYQEMLDVERVKRNETNELFIPPGPRLGDVVINAQTLRKSYADKVLFDNLNFKVPPGATVGIIGPNGAGKTTLFKLLTGKEEPDNGTITLGETVKLSYIDQEREMDGNKTVLDVISGGEDVVHLGKLEVNARAYASRFNFNGDDHMKPIKNISGGERNRVHLATMLKEGGNVLLLDEPTNDLDVNTLRALEDALMEFAGCVLVISHDRYFLDRIATHILAFEDMGEVVWFDGNYTQYEEDRRRRLGEKALHPHRYVYKKLSR
ncbi:MAG: energy-dependent translational throttle protein EttA [Oligoflexia bacterium]|nr:energy-dependent translational throttle protein EttA [Oligoflexia bacterium]